MTLIMIPGASANKTKTSYDKNKIMICVTLFSDVGCDLSGLSKHGIKLV